MILMALLVLVGIAAPFIGIAYLVKGIRRKNSRMIVCSILGPILYWIVLCLVGRYADSVSERIIRENPTNWVENVW